MQGGVVNAEGGKVSWVQTEMPHAGLIGGHVQGVCCDGYRPREVRLLPAGSCFSREGNTRQERAGATPQMACMGARVGGALVKPNARDIAVAVCPELDPEFQRRVWPSIGGRGHRRARPNRART